MADEAAICTGALVTHVDGTVAFCTEEHEDGRTCLGYEVKHARPPEHCWLKAHGDPCAVCDEEQPPLG
jgi:hypothetical protein